MDSKFKPSDGIMNLADKIRAIGKEQEIRNGCRVCGAKLIDEKGKPLPVATLLYLDLELKEDFFGTPTSPSILIATCKEHTPNPGTRGVHPTEILNPE